MRVECIKRQTLDLTIQFGEFCEFHYQLAESSTHSEDSSAMKFPMKLWIALVSKNDLI